MIVQSVIFVATRDTMMADDGNWMDEVSFRSVVVVGNENGGNSSLTGG